jgi:hypothetical protein
LLQQELIAKASGISENEIKDAKEWYSELYEIIVNSNDNKKLKTDLTNKVKETLTNLPNIEIPNGMSKEDFVSMQVNEISTPWMVYFMKFNPVITLEKVKCPVLAVNGEKDLQVPPKENLTAIKNALKKGGNKNVTTIEFPNLNHLFQECETGSPNEYATIKQTISPIVLKEITRWIKLQTK